MYDIMLKINYKGYVTGPCEFLVMYDEIENDYDPEIVTGPCEFLVMYDNYLVYFCF